MTSANTGSIENAVPIDSSPARARRRSTDEVKRLIRDAALEVFKEHGYAPAKTREIAERAGVSEPVIFRHFQSKAKLFEQVVLESVGSFVRGFYESWETVYRQRPHDPAVPLREFVEQLYDLLHENRKIMQVYLSAAALGEVEGISAGDDFLGRLLSGFEPLGIDEFGFLQMPDIDIPVAVRAGFGMVLSLAVFGETMFPGHRHPGRDRIVAECAKILADGWKHR